MALEVTVLRVGNSYAVTIPKQIAKMLCIRKGDKLKVSIENDRIIYSL